MCVCVCVCVCVMQRLREMGLPVSGKKADLVQRILAAGIGQKRPIVRQKRPICMAKETY